MTIFQVVHKSRWLLQETRNVFYYETITGNPSQSEWQDIVDEIRADYVAFPESRFSVDWEFYGLDYREVSAIGLPGFSVNPTAGLLVGSSANDDLPTQIALLVSVKVNTTKPNHARSYLPGMNILSITDGIWNALILTEAQDFIDEQSVLNALGTNELQRVAAQWNTSHTQVIDYNNLAASPSVGSQVPATQRRRRIGVGI